MKLFRISPHLFISLIVLLALLFTGCKQSYTDEHVESNKESVYDDSNNDGLDEDYADDEWVNQTVYITENGTKYHIEDCQYLQNSSIAVTLGEALDKGYTPCSKCNPPE